MESFSLCDSRLGAKICSSSVHHESYPLDNLLSTTSSLSGFMTEYYIRPPVTVTVHLPVPVTLDSVQWETTLGSQSALCHEVWTCTTDNNGDLPTSCGKNCTQAKKMEDNSELTFEKVGRGEARDGFIKFVNYELRRSSEEGYRLRCSSLETARRGFLTRTCCVSIKILTTSKSTVPCIRNLKIFGRKPYVLDPRFSSLQEKLLGQIKDIQDGKHNSENSISFFGCQSEKDDDGIEVIEDTSGEQTQKEKGKISDSEEGKLEIPKEFLDEITQELMSIPMTLPCGKTVDQSTVEKCEHGQAMWGGPPRDPFTGRLFTKTVKPIFCAGLKSRIDRFVLENQGRSEVKSVGRTLGSAKKISEFLDEKHRGVKRMYGGETSLEEETRLLHGDKKMKFLGK